MHAALRKATTYACLQPDDLLGPLPWMTLSLCTVMSPAGTPQASIYSYPSMLNLKAVARACPKAELLLHQLWERLVLLYLAIEL